MRKLFVDKIENDCIALLGDEHKHLSIVLRAKVGQNYVVVDKNGLNFSCKIEKITKEQTILRVLERVDDFTEPNVNVTLYFGALKGEGNDLTVRHAVELGIDRIVPFLSRYTVAQAIKQERLNKIALEAAKQCGRSKIPFVEGAIDFKQMVEQAKNHDLTLFLYENAQHSIKDYLKGATTYKTAGIIIGAEGGFSPEEVDMLEAKKIEPISMGKRILKADTAAAAAITCFMYQSGNLQ